MPKYEGSHRQHHFESTVQVVQRVTTFFFWTNPSFAYMHAALHHMLHYCNIQQASKDMSAVELCFMCHLCGRHAPADERFRFLLHAVQLALAEEEEAETAHTHTPCRQWRTSTVSHVMQFTPHTRDCTLITALRHQPCYRLRQACARQFQNEEQGYNVLAAAHYEM
jgi:hypothetical protein